MAVTQFDPAPDLQLKRTFSGHLDIGAESLWNIRRTELALPLSGCHAVITERPLSSRMTIFDARGVVLGVLPDWPSATSQTTAQGWAGQSSFGPWCLLVGRSANAPVRVTLIRHDASAPQHVWLPAVHSGHFWLAEIAAAAEGALVVTDGASTHPVKLQAGERG